MVKNDLLREIKCSCQAAADKPAFYTQLGAAPSEDEILNIIQIRTGYSKEQIELKEIIHTHNKGINSDGCPRANCIIRRSGDQEKVLALFRKRPGHVCHFSHLIVSLVVWDGISKEKSNELRSFLMLTLPYEATPLDRGCGKNKKKSCMCQGFICAISGKSYAIGCQRDWRRDRCKFCRSKHVDKYGLSNTEHGKQLANYIHNLLSEELSPLMNKTAPDAYYNMCLTEASSTDCRLGQVENLTVPDLSSSDGPLSPVEGQTFSQLIPTGKCNTCLTEASSMDCRQCPVESLSVPLLSSSNSQFSSIEGEPFSQLEPLYNQLPPVTGRPFTGAAIPMDFSTHLHKDVNNIKNGCTAVVTLTNDVGNDNASDEQFHVLPCYKLNTQGSSTTGGVALALTHGSVLFEVARLETHASTALRYPNVYNPTRISMVFYQHRGLVGQQHGSDKYLRRSAQKKYIKYIIELSNGNSCKEANGS